MSEIELLKKEIDELEEELEGLEFGSCMYDFANAEVECKYLELDKLEKSLDTFDKFGIL